MPREKGSNDDRNKAWQSIQRTTQQQAKSDSSAQGIPAGKTDSGHDGQFFFKF